MIQILTTFLTDTSWLSPVISVIVSAFLSGLVGYLVKRRLDKYFNSYDKKVKETQAKLDEADTLKEEKIRIERKEDMVEVVQELLVSINLKIDNVSNKLDKVEDGTKSSLRNSICNYYYHCSDKAYRNDLDYENMHRMFDSYIALGGNSFIKDMIHRFDELPTKEEYIKEQVKLGNTAKVRKALHASDLIKDETIVSPCQNKTNLDK